jgi:methylphosphotriester-DNA--protein-cysteine methyltransferase
MHFHSQLQSPRLKSLIRQGEIKLAGNRQLKIYGRLSCNSGKRIKKDNRVFFGCELEALNLGFRPCGHCLKGKYEIWKRRH